MTGTRLRTSNAFALLFGAGLVVRLVLMLTTLVTNDNLVYGGVIDAARAHAPLYRSAAFSYPPLPGYYLEGVGHVLQAANLPTFVRYENALRYAIPDLTSMDFTTPFATFLIKAPALVLDMLCALSVARAVLALGRSRGDAERAALLWWLNPMTLWSGGVAGTWDAIVPIAFIESLLAARGGRWFAAGTIVAFGTFARIVPGYALFVTLPLVLRGIDASTAFSRARVAAIRVARFAAGGALVSAILLAPILIWNELGAMRHALFARFGDFSPTGLTVLSFVHLIPFASALPWLQAHREAVVALYGALSLAAPLAVAAALLVAPPDLRTSLAAAAALLVSLLVFSPFVQGNYVLWLVPLLAAFEHESRWWSRAAWGLGAIAATFAHVVRGTAGILYPACAWYRFCDLPTMAERSFAYHELPGTLGTTVQIERDAVLGQAGGILLIFVAIFSYRHLFMAVGRTRRPHPR
jgi:hypothetical protein